MSDGTGSTAALTIKNVAALYHECRVRHGGLVDAILRAGPSGKN